MLEQHAASFIGASVEDVRSSIRSGKPARADTSRTNDGANEAFGAHSPVEAKLLFKYCVKSKRFNLARPIGKMSSNMARAWRKSLDYREGAARYRELVEAGVQAIMNLDEKDPEAAELLLNDEVLEAPTVLER